MPNMPTKEELISGWEHVLKHGKHSEGMEQLLHVTVDVLKGELRPEKQKAIDTWQHILIHERSSITPAKRIEATVFYMMQERN